MLGGMRGRRIKGLERYRGRNSGDPFSDLPWEAKMDAQRRLHRYQEKWGFDMNWRFPILVGQARRWARTSPEERAARCRSMRATKGGLAVQRRYRAEGRKDPAALARMVRRNNRMREKNKARTKYDRVGYTFPIWEQ